MIRSGRWGVRMDVGGCLRNLGLGQYEALFRASDIDADILPELTEIDLEKLGVSLGHRKRLLRAISGLAAAETAAGPPRTARPEPARPPGAAAAEGDVLQSRRLDGVVGAVRPGGI